MGTCTGIKGYNALEMSCRAYKLMGLFLAALFFASSLTPVAWAEAQVRCMSASSAGCVRAGLPAERLSSRRMNTPLMACCRPQKTECTPMLGCPMPHTTAFHQAVVPTRFTVSPPKHLACVCAAPNPVPPVLHRFRWLLASSPALAPPAAAATVFAPGAVSVCLGINASVLSPHLAPAQHGLRAPPA